MSFYTFDILGRFAGVSPVETDRSTAVEPPAMSADYNWNGMAWVYAPSIQSSPITQQAAQPSRILTKLEYMNRFTDGELAGIYTAAKASIAVEIWLEKFKLATEINLDDPRTSAGLYALEAAGLLAAGRADQIIQLS